MVEAVPSWIVPSSPKVAVRSAPSYAAGGLIPAVARMVGATSSRDAGALLRRVASIQGALKTNAVVALAFPLVILAVPILDTAFVVAKRIKYRQPIYQADRWHFHHRFANLGFSQRKTLAYLYGWTLVLALLALALRFVPYSDDRGNFDPVWTAIMAAVILLAVAASVYLAIVLEIVKRRSPREAVGEAADGVARKGSEGESPRGSEGPGP